MPRDKTFTEKSSLAKRQQKSQDRQGFTAGEGKQVHNIQSTTTFIRCDNLREAAEKLITQQPVYERV